MATKPTGKPKGRPPKAGHTTDIEQRFITLMGFGHVPLDEFLTFLTTVPTVEGKASYLRRFAESRQERKDAIRVLAECVWDNSIQLELPAGDPPYTNTSDHTTAAASLYKVVRQLVYYVKNNKNFIQNTMKREQHFIQTLEKLSANEARLLIMMKDKQLKGYMGITDDVIRMAYPNWLPPKKPQPLGSVSGVESGQFSNQHPNGVGKQPSVTIDLQLPNTIALNRGS